MFTENMKYWEMNRMLKDIEKARNLKVVELAEGGELTEQDIELFLAAYLEEFNLNEKDLNNLQKVAGDIFDLAAFLQRKKTRLL